MRRIDPQARNLCKTLHGRLMLNKQLRHLTIELQALLFEQSKFLEGHLYVLLRASESFKHPTRRVHELWQADFTHLQVEGWGWYYLSTVMDDFSRYIIAWMLSSTMGTADVQNTLDLALQRTGVAQVHVRHRPRLLSDNGPAYVSGELRRYLNSIGMTHTRGAPYHPMTQGKIERWHRSMKNVIKLEHYSSPGQLEAAIDNFVDYYNQRALSRVAEQRPPGSRLLRQAPRRPDRASEDQTTHHATKEEGEPSRRCGLDQEPSLSF